MATNSLPNSLLFGCYRASIFIIMISLLYAGVILFIAALGSKINLSRLNDFFDFVLLVLVTFPGFSSLYIWTDYSRSVAINSACRSTKIEVVGIASCPPTLLVCFSIGKFFGIA